MFRLRFLMLYALSFFFFFSFAGEKKDTITLFTFNDFHGAYVPSPSQPGAAYLASLYIEEFSKVANAVTLCGGDNYSGGYFSRITKGEPIDDFFKTMNVTASAVGNHEFDWGVDYLAKAATKGVPYLAANIYSDSLHTTHPQWVKPYLIKSIVLSEKDTIKMAIIGLSTLETLTTTKAENLKGLYFSAPLKEAKFWGHKLKDSAQLIVLLCHIGSETGKNEQVLLEADAQGLLNIDEIDALVSAHYHKKVEGKINGKPVVQALSNGRALGKIQWEITTVSDSNGIHRTKRCIDVAVKEVGSDIKPLQSLQTKIDELLHDTAYGFLKPLTLNLQELRHDREQINTCFTEVGTLVTESYANRYLELMSNKSSKSGKASNIKIPVIGVCNFGGIRTGFSKGEICALDAGNVIPFGGELRAFCIDGKTLIRLFDYGINNKNGCMQSHSIKLLTDSKNKVKAVFSLVSKNKWKEIKDSDSCVVVAESFIVSGGDSYPTDCFVNEIEAFKLIDPEEKNPTDAFINFLSKVKEIKISEIRKPICEE